MNGERCMCGDYSCHYCGHSTVYRERYVAPDSDQLYERDRQKQLDEAVAAGDADAMKHVLRDMTVDSVEQFRRDRVQRILTHIRREP